MKALSIRQPWIWAILHSDKRVENRDWKPRNPNLHFRGECYIHASLKLDADCVDDIRDIFYATGKDPLLVPNPAARSADDPDNPYPLGGIVGRARVTGIIRQSTSPWFFGPLALVLEDVKPVPFVPCKGKLGFFDVPKDVAAQLKAAA